MGRVVVPATVESLEDLYRVQRGDQAEATIRRIQIDEALIDTGATALSLPKRFINQLGLLPLRTRRVLTTSGFRDAATFGAVKLTINGRDCVCDVTEVADECPVLIGQVPLELMDFVVDPARKQLTGNPAHGGELVHELM